jgi:uncharacterized membrane protein
MKLQIFRRKQFSFLPVKLSINGSPFKPLEINSFAEFDVKSDTAACSLSLFGMKRDVTLSLNDATSNHWEMYFNLDKNQLLLVFLGLLACIFLTISSILTKNFTHMSGAVVTFVVILLVSVCHSMQLGAKEKTD